MHLSKCLHASLPSLCLALSLASLTSHAFTEGNYTYTVTDAKSTITAFNMSYSGPLSITNTLGGYPVTSIQGAGFGHCDGLTVVTIPDSVTSLGSYAFSSCGGMTSVTIPNSVISIGNNAFQYCIKLPSITIPASVTSIRGSVFNECRGLTAIAVDQANEVYASSNGVLFNKTTTTLITCPEGKTGAYTIPGSVTSIADGAFQACDSLTSVVIPGSITSIGYYAFLHCTGLTSVLFKGTPPSLGGYNTFSSTAATLYYLPTVASNWPSTFDYRPTRLWNPTVQCDADFGVLKDGFGFNIAGTPDIPVKVEATTNLASGVWTSLTNTTLGASGALQFTDPTSTNKPSRFYRIVWP